MPKTVHLPSRGIDLSFPDAASDEQIVEAINNYYPRNGEDVAYEFSQDPSFGTTISSSDYKLFEDYMKSKPGLGVSGWAGAIVEGGKQLVSEAAAGVKGLVSEPQKAVANLIEATGVGTVALKNLLTQSTDPDSVFFKAKDLLTGGGSIEDRRRQFIEASNALVQQQKVARGEETVLMPRESITPETTQGLSNITDITMLIPGLNLAGFGAKAGAKVVGGTLKVAGKTLKGVARGAEVVGDVTKSILKSQIGSDVEQAMAQAASVGARVPLVGEAQGIYRALTLAGREGGQLLEDIGGQVGLPGRLGPLERVAASETATPLTKTLAIAGKKIGGDFVLDISPRIVGGAIEGATIGGVLGGLSAGEEGAAQGIGGGIAMGALGGGIGRLGERFFGAKRNQDVAADFDRAVGSSGLDEIGIQRVTRMVSEAQKAGVDMRAQMADFLNEAARNNVKVSFVNDSDKPSILKDITGQDVPSVKFKGVTVEGLLSTGEKDGQIHVLLNTDRMDTTTAFHELFEALVMRQVDQNALDLAGREIFGELQGESPEGFTLQKDPQVKPEQVVEFVNQYTKHLEDKEVKAIYENAVALLRDETAPLEQRKKARAFLTRELLAYRTGAKAEGGKKGYQDVFLSGRIPTFLDNAFDRSKKRAAKNAAVDSALDFSEGIEPAFRDEKGNLRPAPTADSVINKILDIKTSLDPEEVVGAIPATPENIAKLEALGIDPKRVRKSGGKVKVVDAKPISKAEVQDVINTPATPEEKAAGVGDVTLDGESFVYSRGLSDAQMEKLRAKMPANQFRMLKQINDALKMGRDAEGNQTLPIFEATHVPEKPTYEGIPVSTRNKLIYSVEFNKKGQIYFRVLDVLSAKGNLDKMFKRGKFRDAYESPKQAYQDLIGRYLGNLDSVSPKDSATVLGDGNLALGEKRRNLLNAALRFWKADTYFNLPDAELVSMMKAGGEESVKSMRNDRMLYMRPTGEVSTFRLDAYNLGKRNYQPAGVDRAYLDSVNRGDIAAAQRIVDQASGLVKDKSFFTQPNKFYRIIVGDESFRDILQTGLVRTNEGSKIAEGASLSEKLAARPTAFPSFSKDSASLYYANQNPNHYIIVTEDSSIKASKLGRHSKGKTYFPTDSNGNPVKTMSGESVSVYRHEPDGVYKLVYDKGSPVRQIDPIAMDNSGNVIPPSQRFGLPESASGASFGSKSYQPDTVGTKRVLKGQDGSNIIEGTKGWRAYSPSGSLDGVFGTIEEAIKAIGRRRDKDQGPTKADLMLKVQEENANLADIAAQKSNLKQSTFSDLINIPGMSPETTKQVLATVFEYDRVLDQYRRRMVNKVVVEEAKSRLPGAPLLSKVRDYVQLAEKRATQSSLEYKKNIERLERADRLARENIEKIKEQMPDAEKRDLIRRINQSKTVRVPQQTISPSPSMYSPKGIQEQKFVPQ